MFCFETQYYQLKSDQKGSKTRKKNSKKSISTRCGSFQEQSAKKFKTETCRYWSTCNTCPFGINCKFAHGYNQMRSKDVIPHNYRTKECTQYVFKGYCSFGVRCQFIHPLSFAKTYNPSKRMYMFITHDKQLFFAFNKRLKYLQNLSIQQSKIQIQLSNKQNKNDLIHNNQLIHQVPISTQNQQ